MRRRENQCVDCGLPSLGDSCPYRNVEVVYCDICGDEGAEYEVDNQDMCEECAKKYVQESLDDLTLSEKAKLLDISFSEL